MSTANSSGLGRFNGAEGNPGAASTPSYGGLMAASMAISSISSLSSAFSEAQAVKMKGEFQQSVSKVNKQMADVAASDALNRGEQAVNLNMKRVRQVIGAQRTSMAAQGVDVNTGSAKDIQQDTAGQGALDSMMIRNNAFREAMGYRVQALNYTPEIAAIEIATFRRGLRHFVVPLL